jgi:L-asparaginase / beta-aspartyl-peptidase
VKRSLILFWLLAPAAFAAGAKPIALAVHGGTGVPKKELTAEAEKLAREDLASAVRAGLEKLKKKGGGLDAVEAAIRFLEDSPRFNAGKGAVFTREGRNELDASIMEGKQKRAGAVSGVTTVKNPIRAARAVMETTPHVLVAGRGAELVAGAAGLELVDPSYFWTEHRWKALQEFLSKKKAANEPPPGRQWGTVGSVAVDKDGNLFAGTSTGGMTGKMPGRMGDSPIIGAGTYADNEGCAVSATGHGEYFIRYHVASDINALVKYKAMTVEAAGNEVIHKKVVPAGGEGGVIILDAKGNFAAPFHSDGLYRATIAWDGSVDVQLY